MDTSSSDATYSRNERSSLLGPAAVNGNSTGTSNISRSNSWMSISSNVIDTDTDGETDGGGADEERQKKKEPQKRLSLWTITFILSTAFAYGCIMTTLFLITLPVECDRIERQQQEQVQEQQMMAPTISTSTTAAVIPKSVALGCFVAIAGVTQLISPLIGMLSDTYRPPYSWHLGQRMPYLCLGSILSCFGLMGEYVTSFQRLWLRYGFFFFCHMIGLNMTYAMMIALIPDQVPHQQTGTANGILALLLVTGSLSGFGLFHFFAQRIQDMYGLYLCIVIITTILTGLYAHDRDAKLLARLIIIKNKHHRKQRQQQQIRPQKVTSATGQDLRDSGSRTNGNENFPVLEVGDRRRDDSRPYGGAAVDESIVVGENIILSHRTQQRRHRREKRRRIMLGPFVLLRTMVYDPFMKFDKSTLLATYTIDVSKHHDFFIVTISRLCYYCGSSVQTFFLYFLHDIIGVTENPESTVAALAVVSQISGALICYPVGRISDTFCDGRRKPFVYISCVMLGGVTAAMIFARSMETMTILLFILGLANGKF